MANAKAQAAAAALKERQAQKDRETDRLAESPPAPTSLREEEHGAEPVVHEPRSAPVPSAPAEADAVSEPVIDRAGIDPDPPKDDKPKRPTAPTAKQARKQLVEADVEAVAAAVSELPKQVFAEVPDPAIKQHLRDAVQAVRVGVAVARARGVLPRRTLTTMIVVDEQLEGKAQIFAGDRTA